MSVDRAPHFGGRWTGCWRAGMCDGRALTGKQSQSKGFYSCLHVREACIQGMYFSGR